MNPIALNLLLHRMRPDYVSRVGRPRTLELSYVLDRISCSSYRMSMVQSACPKWFLENHLSLLFLLVQTALV